MKIEDHFKDTLNRAVGNEPPVRDAWSTFERRVGRGRWVRWSAGLAAAVFVAIAAIIAVPKLARDDRVVIHPATQPTTTSATPTEGPYAGWVYASNQTMRYRVHYPKDWDGPSSFEGVDSLQPPDVEPLEKGSPTFAVTITFQQGQKFSPRSGSGVAVARDDGRRNYVVETPKDDTREMYVIEWSACAAGEDPCREVSGTLVVRIIAGSDSLWDRYGSIGSRIAATIEQLDSATPSSSPSP